MYRCWICQHTGLNEMHEQHKGKCTWRNRLRRSLIHRPCTARTPHKNQRTSGRPSLRKRARGERQDNKTSTSQEHALSHTVSFWQLLTQRRRRCSVRRMISHRLFPAWDYITQVGKGRMRTREGGTHLVLHCAGVSSWSVPQLVALCAVHCGLPSCHL